MQMLILDPNDIQLRRERMQLYVECRPRPNLATADAKAAGFNMNMFKPSKQFTHIVSDKQLHIVTVLYTSVVKLAHARKSITSNA